MFERIILAYRLWNTFHYTLRRAWRVSGEHATRQHYYRMTRDINRYFFGENK